MKSTKCPYFPTCSEYGLEAVEKYGAFKGGLLALWRIIRCNPFSKGGYDTVPERACFIELMKSGGNRYCQELY